MPSKNEALNLSRRRFLTRVLPACSLVSLGASSNLLGLPGSSFMPFQETKHKFDEEFPMKFTNRQLVSAMYNREFIPMLKFISEEIGKERLIELLKEHAAKKGLEMGKGMAKQFGGNDFAIARQPGQKL